MPGYVYPTIAEALEIHRQLIEEFGGTPEVRDRGRLEAALFRPQTGYYTELVEEAAALMESLANNHAFVDGNKRVAFVLTDTFLRLNGFYLEVEPRTAYKFVEESIAQGRFRFGPIRDWLRGHLRPVSKS